MKSDQNRAACGAGFFDLLKHRHSVRRFTDAPVPREVLDNILRAANAAPVGSNLYRDVHLTVVQDREVLSRLTEAAQHRLKDRDIMRAITSSISDREATPRNQYNPFYGAPVVIFVSHRKQTLQPGIEYCNVASLVQTMHLAAAAQGLGSVYMWGCLEAMRVYPQYDNSALLNLPPDFEPLLGLAIGYEDGCREPRELTVEKIGLNYV